MKRKIVALILVVVMLVMISACSRDTIKDSPKETSKEATTDITETTAPSETTESDRSSSGYRAQDADNVNPAGVLPVIKNPTKLRLAMNYRAQIEDYYTNEYTLFIQEKTGVEFEFDLLPGGEDTMQRVNLMFASNELPDVFVGMFFNDGPLFDYGTQGMIQPLNDLIEIYGFWMKEMFERAENPNVRGLLTFSDGNIYYVPRYAEQSANYYTLRAWIYEPWLQKLGLDVPTTIDEYYNVLLAFRDQDLNDNGRKDEIPLIGLSNVTQFFINSFIHDPGGKRLIIHDGKLDVNFNKPEFKEALMWLNKLVNENLLDPMSFTTDIDQLKVLFSQPDVIVGSTAHIIISGIILDRTNEQEEARSQEYVPIMPLKGPAGLAYTNPTPPNPLAQWVITSACENPAAAFRVGDFMLSEEATMFSRWGREGYEWERPESGTPGMWGGDASVRVIHNIWGAASQNIHWWGWPPFFMQNKHNNQARPDNPRDSVYVANMVSKALADYAPEEFVPRKLPYTLEEMDELALIEPPIISYVGENIARFIVGDRSFSEWENYLREFDRLQLEKYIQINRDAYERVNNSN